MNFMLVFTLFWVGTTFTHQSCLPFQYINRGKNPQFSALGIQIYGAQARAFNVFREVCLCNAVTVSLSAHLTRINKILHKCSLHLPPPHNLRFSSTFSIIFYYGSQRWSPINHLGMDVYEASLLAHLTYFNSSWTVDVPWSPGFL